MAATLVLRNSERSSYNTCRFRWHWTWVEGRQARTAPTALRFGDLVHQALAAYYKPGRRRGPKPAQTFERLYHAQAAALVDDGFDIHDDEKWVDALDLGINMLEGYVREYTEPDKEFEVISSEQTFQRRIRAERPSDAPESWPRLISFIIVGTLDGVWRHLPSGRLEFKEFKTASQIKESGLAMDEQPTLYWTYGPKWLARRGIITAEEARNLNQIRYTFLRKQMVIKHNDAGQPIGPSGRVVRPVFKRVPVYRDAPERGRLHARVIAQAFELHEARLGRMPTWKVPGPLHNPNCDGCAVREACEVHEAGGNWRSVLDASTVPWDPYAAHELPERY